MRIHSRNAFGLVIVVMLITGHQLPAPISEETPAPKPAATARPKPKAVAKSKPEVTARPTPKPTPVSYTGTWSGLINSHCGEVDYSGELLVTVSANERTVQLRLSGAQDVYPCSSNGTFVQWQRDGYVFTLRMNPDGRTAGYSCKWTMDGAACLASGTLARR